MVGLRHYLATGLLVLLGVAAQGASERELIGVLASEAPLQQKARACQQLALVGGEAAVPALAALLGDEHLGDYARFGLQPIESTRVDDALRDAMGTLEGRHLVGVVNSVGLRRDVKAVPALQALAADPAKGAAPEALMALGRIATHEANATIRGVLVSGPPALRVAAADAALVAAERLLAENQRAEAVSLYDVICSADLPGHLRTAATYGAIVSRGEAGVPLLVATLKSEDASTVGVALRAARELSGPEVSRALFAELEKSSTDGKVRLIGVLKERQDAGVRSAFETLAGSRDLPVREAALKALGDVGNAASVPALLKGLGGESAVAADIGLRALKGDGVDAAILAGLGGTAGDARVRLIAILVDRRCTNAVPQLLTEAANDDTAIAQAAFKALGELATPEETPALVALLLAAPSGPVARQAENAVVRIAAETADPVVDALAAAPSSTARVALIRVLGRMGGDQAYAAITKARTDADPAVEDAAVRALAAWPDHRAADALLAIVKQAEDETHRVLALRGYVRLVGLEASDQPGAAASRLAEAMALSRTVATRKAVLGALANVPHRDALELAMSHIDDAALRAEAELAAVSIARTITGAEPEAVRAAAAKLVASADTPIVEEARGILEQLDRFADAITAWRISGPYMQEGKDYAALFTTVFEPEKPDAKNVTWQSIAAGTHPTYPQILDLRKALGGDQRVAYALTWVHSENAQEASLQMGSDDGIKAWLNGKLVHAKNVARAATPYTDKVNVKLNKGWNPLLLKITQNQFPWEFCARICRQDDEPLEGLRIDPNHEGEWRLNTPAPTEGPAPPPMKGAPIYDGTFEGWEGNLTWFRIEEGAIVGGTLKEAIPRNEFLCTTKEYANFQLRLKLKLVDNMGNAGIQIRSRRIPNHHEMIGYQADVGQVYWGALYDESRRREVLAGPNQETLDRALRKGQWNDYVIRCEGKRIQLWLNGVQTVDYTEPDPQIEQTGIIGLQIHAGEPSEIWYKDIEIETLP